MVLQFHLNFLYILNRFNVDIELIKHNAEVASQISVELSNLRNDRDKDNDKSQLRCHPSFTRSTTNDSTSKRPAVIGASILDFTAKIQSQQIKVDMY